MTTDHDAYDEALTRAMGHAKAWLSSVGERPVPPSATVEVLTALVGGPLPPGPSSAADVVDLMAGVEPGLMAIGSGRFYGWVMGGTLPAALAAD